MDSIILICLTITLVYPTYAVVCWGLSKTSPRFAGFRKAIARWTLIPAVIVFVLVDIPIAIFWFGDTWIGIGEGYGVAAFMVVASLGAGSYFIALLLFAMGSQMVKRLR